MRRIDYRLRPATGCAARTTGHPCPAGPTDEQRVGGVEAAVADVAEGDLTGGFVDVLQHRQRVGQELGRMDLIGQAVEHRHIRVLDQRVDDLLAGAAEFDRVVQRPSTRAVSFIDSLWPICDVRGRCRSRAAPSSCAATSNAHRVRVDVFSKISAMFLPTSCGSS